MNQAKQFIANEDLLFACDAQVYRLDSGGNTVDKQWIDLTNCTVSVNLYFEKTKKLHRLLCVCDLQPVININVEEMVNLSKSSSKFAHWGDVGTHSIYGLGFTTDSEMEKFICHVEKIQGCTKQKILVGPTVAVLQNGISAPINNISPQSSTNMSITTVNDGLENLLAENEKLRSALGVKTCELLQLADRLCQSENQYNALKVCVSPLDEIVELKKEIKQLRSQICQFEKNEQTSKMKLLLVPRIRQEIQFSMAQIVERMQKLEAVFES